MSREPAVIVGLGTAVLACLVAFGVPITNPQVEAIRDLLVVVAPILAAIITRRFVWSPDGHAREVRAAVARHRA